MFPGRVLYKVCLSNSTCELKKKDLVLKKLKMSSYTQVVYSNTHTDSHRDMKNRGSPASKSPTNDDLRLPLPLVT